MNDLNRLQINKKNSGKSDVGKRNRIMKGDTMIDMKLSVSEHKIIETSFKTAIEHFIHQTLRDFGSFT